MAAMRLASRSRNASRSTHDGDVRNARRGVSIAARKCAPIGFAMADPALDFGVEMSGPLGPWVIEAVAHDRVKGTRASARYELVIRQPAARARPSAR
jgi:hypothetical protein